MVGHHQIPMVAFQMFSFIHILDFMDLIYDTVYATQDEEDDKKLSKIERNIIWNIKLLF